MSEYVNVGVEVLFFVRLAVFRSSAQSARIGGAATWRIVFFPLLANSRKKKRRAVCGVFRPRRVRRVPSDV